MPIRPLGLEKKSNAKMIRATLFLSGRVQGVGLRHTTKEIAKRFAVVGFVENLDDGRVRIVVEAESDEIDRFIEAVKTSIAGNLRHIDRFESEPSREFGNFSANW
jgi:acylphosphatase